METIIAVILAFSIMVGGTTGIEELEVIDPNMENLPQTIEEVLASSSTILSSSENITTATQLLAALPEPDNKFKLAVYSVEDKTGQYQTGGSRVVTQGATEMLITALQRSRQFKILDRVRFGDFMNEQNLKTNKRINQGDGPSIGGMTGANYVLSGAITEYQVDQNTSGIGLKIAGKGGSQKYARASCAIDLRLTDTTSGEVVWAKSLKSEIIGKKVGFQIFSFIGENVVEFETGKGKQQVINLVVRTLLEEAVYELSSFFNKY